MEYSLVQFGGELKKSNLNSSISYGSGGFCVILRDINGTEYSGYNWDIVEAFRLAKNKFDISEEFSNEDTVVDFHKKDNKS